MKTEKEKSIESISVTKTSGHDKKGKKIDVYFGTFTVQGYKKIELVFTNIYRTEKMAIKKCLEKINKYYCN